MIKKFFEFVDSAFFSELFFHMTANLIGFGYIFFDREPSMLDLCCVTYFGLRTIVKRQRED